MTDCDSSSSDDCRRKCKKSCRGPRGHKGCKGATGAVGPTGPNGSIGPTGPSGDASLAKFTIPFSSGNIANLSFEGTTSFGAASIAFGHNSQIILDGSGNIPNVGHGDAFYVGEPITITKLSFGFYVTGYGLFGNPSAAVGFTIIASLYSSNPSTVVPPPESFQWTKLSDYTLTPNFFGNGIVDTFHNAIVDVNIPVSANTALLVVYRFIVGDPGNGVSAALNGIANASIVAAP